MPQPRTTLARIRAALPRMLAAATALIVAATALAACGGAKSPSAAASEQAKERSAEARFAEFAKCLREHGVNASATTAPGGQGVGIKVQGTSGASGPQQMEVAQRACKQFQPPERKLHVSPQEQVAHEEEVRKFATCMREHGIDVHASAAGGGIQIAIHAKPGGGGPNPESPAFQAGQKACQGLLPFKGAPRAGRAPAGGGAPGTGSSADGEAGSAASSGG